MIGQTKKNRLREKQRKREGGKKGQWPKLNKRARPALWTVKNPLKCKANQTNSGVFQSPCASVCVSARGLLCSIISTMRQPATVAGP